MLISSSSLNCVKNNLQVYLCCSRPNNGNEEIAEVAIDYFMDLFTTMSPHRIDIALASINSTVTDKMIK